MIAARLAELRGEAQKQAQYTVQDAIRELNEALELSKVSNRKTGQAQTAAMVQAIQTKIKLLGLEQAAKVDITTNGESLNSGLRIEIVEPDEIE